MCIRDRIDAERRINRREEIALADGIIADVDAVFVGGAIDPVSYTHLRAHETVLDLVCRLLLEKKKISSSYIYTTS